MNQKNYEYLKDQIKYSGFGDTLNNSLKENMDSNAPQFSIIHEPKIGSEIFLTTLHFKKSEQNDMYFFNKYDVEMKASNSSEKLKQTFYINKGNSITLKESYNLLKGRAVNKDLTNKDGQIYNAWVQLDFKQTEPSSNFKMNHYHQNYGYDLNNELSKLPIKEMGINEDRPALLQSLQKGNLQSVTFFDSNNGKKVFIEANPQFKTINVYDSSMTRMEKEALAKEQSKANFPIRNSIGSRQSSTSESKQHETGVGNDEFGSNIKSNHKTKREGLSH